MSKLDQASCLSGRENSRRFSEEKGQLVGASQMAQFTREFGFFTTENLATESLVYVAPRLRRAGSGAAAGEGVG